MDVMKVKGGNPLKGTVRVEGAKNAVLPIIAASILGTETVSDFQNVPNLSDVHTMLKVLDALQVKTNFNEENYTVKIDATGQLSTTAPFEYVSKMRASIVVMGPLLARYNHAKVALPGGCTIGSRPIDIHLKGFEAMGAKITLQNGYVEATCDGLHGATIYLDFPSVGATQNLMMAASLATGTTILENVAREPEIVDLANYLNKMGAKIVGAGTETLRIEGVDQLRGTNHAIIPDRIEAGTFMIAAAVTGGDVFIEDAVVEHNRALVAKLTQMRVVFRETPDGIRVIGPRRLKATDAKTLPYPGFPTDIQAPFTIAQVLADGKSSMTETVFENRFRHLEEMRRMNLNFTTQGQTAFLPGNTALNGAVVAATDLRAAAALIIAGLCATGETTVTNLQYLDRGYYHFKEKLESLGANITRVESPITVA
ncbi:MAG TPA: UDP-N-acetylglucosamine 1-carboxyvinyltransferase [Bavariicoccus seileri]|uniref:UDP-N-acetylglucosamine 1-carboxyvinyltransferase n=1 Tax=Bavariicoccus seileri TaxID=549685 RepID=A0A3D4S771_9ENTE|nr:UDP-N-acetylglucosamine 1-carboxyvinyltransferase [Bavariicoccus seileri]HCS93801.1 UDP-N-acetylglucosamine 1-carboxyvinyltransferase [Bavariicoccus seileri]